MDHKNEEDSCVAPARAGGVFRQKKSGRRKEREGGRFERRDLLYLSGVHAPL